MGSSVPWPQKKRVPATAAGEGRTLGWSARKPLKFITSGTSPGWQSAYAIAITPPCENPPSTSGPVRTGRPVRISARKAASSRCAPAKLSGSGRLPPRKRYQGQPGPYPHGIPGQGASGVTTTAPGAISGASPSRSKRSEPRPCISTTSGAPSRAWSGTASSYLSMVEGRSLRADGARGGAVVGHDVLPFAGVGARDHGHHRLAVAGVEHLVRHAGLDEDEVARLVLHHLRQSVAVLVAHAPLQGEQHHLEAHVHVRVGHAARGDGGHVHGELPGSHVARRHPGAVADAVPAADVAAAADHQDAVVPLHRGAQVGVVVARQGCGCVAHRSHAGKGQRFAAQVGRPVLPTGERPIAPIPPTISRSASTTPATPTVCARRPSACLRANTLQPCAAPAASTIIIRCPISAP